MRISKSEKAAIKKLLSERFSREAEITKVVLFGSFISSAEPNDLDIAVFQNSDENYITLSMRYRSLLQELNLVLPCDIIPLRPDPQGAFLNEINAGEVIFER